MTQTTINNDIANGDFYDAINAEMEALDAAGYIGNEPEYVALVQKLFKVMEN
jgi:hypothetical protein